MKMQWIYMAYTLPSKQFDGCKDAKGLNLDQFQNDSWLYGKTFITISKLRLHFYKQIDIQSNHTHYSHSFDEIIEAFMGVRTWIFGKETAMSILHLDVCYTIDGNSMDTWYHTLNPKVPKPPQMTN